MIALRVSVNDGASITGGATDLGVLNVIINAIGKLAPVRRAGMECPLTFMFGWAA